MNEFWTKEKLGKHPEVAGRAKDLYSEYALCDAVKLLARLKESKFKFGNNGPIKWKELLAKANLDDCLKQEYIKAALDVTTHQPSIGKGEFLLVSVFDNIGFAKGKGDLVDTITKKTAEVKGNAGALCNAYSGVYRVLNDGILRAVFTHFKMTPPSGLDNKTCQALEQYVARNDAELKYVLTAFRNTQATRIPVIDNAMKSFKDRKDTRNLLNTIAAMHLYEYLSIEKSDYLIAVNNDKFMCFQAPTSVYQAENIISEYFTADYWRVSKGGVTISLK